MYYVKSYFIPLDASLDENAKRFGAETVTDLRKYLIWHYNHSEKSYKGQVFGKEFIYFRTELKIYDSVNLKGAGIGTLEFVKGIPYWITKKGKYIVNSDGSLRR